MLLYGRQLIEHDDIAAVTAQLRSDWLTQALAAITGAKYAVAVSSGTAALYLGAGVRLGDS